MKTKLFLLSLLLWISAYSQAQSQFNCYTIAAGKNATATGNVMLAHNEDDHGKNYLNIHKTKAGKSKYYKLKNGGKFSSAVTQLPALWIEMPGQEFADVFINDAGVMIVSNACPSREDKPELTDGGIGWMLRQITGRHATSARDAVLLAGKLINRFGYASSGRTYTFADQHDIWVMSVVNGKHWIAQRVPDDEIMIIANYYTIQQVNLKDSLNFMGSPDLISYAEKRGWYQPDKDGAFNFRSVYGKPESLAHIGNIARQWQGIKLLSEKSYPVQEKFPFSFKPKHKLTLSDLMRVLENHYEGNEFDDSRYYRCGNPHDGGINSICSDINQFSIVTEFRNDIPHDMGSLCHIAFRRPCIQPYVPFFTGVDAFPDNFSYIPVSKSLSNHFNKAPYESPDSIHLFPLYVTYAKEVDASYATRIDAIRSQKLKRENAYKKRTEIFIDTYRELKKTDPAKASNLLNTYTPNILDEIRKGMKRQLMNN